MKITYEPGDHVRHPSFKGVALVVSANQTYEDIRGYEDRYDEDDLRWDPVYEDEELVVIMVGDDQRHLVDKARCHPLEEAEYCGTCGQIGCGHG